MNTKITNNNIPQKFNNNYQIALENYLNSIKYFMKYKQIIEELEKIITGYKDIIKDFQKKLLQLKGDLLKYFNVNEKFAFKNEKNIFPTLKQYIKYINNIFSFQINCLTKQINDLETKNVFNSIKKYDNLVNILNQNKNNLQSEEKKMEKMINEYDNEYSILMNTLQDSEDKIKKYYVKKRKNSIENKKSKNKDIFDNTIFDAINAEEKFYQIYINFTNNNNNYFHIYDKYLKQLGIEITEISDNINNDFNIFLSIIINYYNDLTTKINQINEKINISKENKTEKKEETIEDKNKIINNDIKQKEENKKLNQDFDSFINKHLNKFERKYKKEKYKVKAIHETYSVDQITNDSKNIMNDLCSELGMDNLLVENPIVLSEEDVYEIVKTFYGPFQFVDKSEYDLSIEKKRIDFKNLTNKLLYFGLKKKNFREFANLQPITEEELSKLENGIKKKRI